MKNKSFIFFIFVVSLLFLSASCNNFMDKYQDSGRDMEAPVAELLNTPANFTNSNEINVTVAGTDVAYYRYNLDGGGWSDETDVADPITASALADGAHSLAVIGGDLAGNWQSEGSATSYGWSVDTVGPSGTFVINNGSTVCHLYWVGLYMNITGADEMRFRNEGGEWSNWEPYINLKKWLISDQISHKHVFAQVRDFAGNILELDDEIEFNSKITPFNSTTGFGECVTISSIGDVVAAGAFRDQDHGTYSGAIYVYKWNGSETKLLASDGASNDGLGDSISITSDGTSIVTGAAGSNGNEPDAGAVYIYTWDGNNWEETKLTASDGETGDGFGWNGVSISADGNIIVVGADSDDDKGAGSGSAYIFTRNNSTWQETKLVASDGLAGDSFGRSVSISPNGDTVTVGAPAAGTVGLIYVYKWNENNWKETVKLSPAVTSGVNAFGWGLSSSLFGNNIAVGAGESYGFKGAMYIFNWNGSNWIETELTASDGQMEDRFGWGAISISEDGNTVITGAGWDDDNGENAGSAYIYKRNNGSWQEKKILAFDGTFNDIFGDNDSVGISADGNSAIVGATFDGSGSAYIFRWNGTEWIDY